MSYAWYLTSSDIPLFKMKTSVVLVVSMVITSVLSTSPPNCANVNCAAVTCNPVNCNCGTYKGSCGCCDVCYKCPGEVCVPLYQHRCTEHHDCVLDDPSVRIEFGSRGKCKHVPQQHDHTNCTEEHH
uniref:Putative secreted protein n=1 Tax=Amblyomma triste TaxID=251400 RepID=A0A023G0S7_AMBTT